MRKGICLACGSEFDIPEGRSGRKPKYCPRIGKESKCSIRASSARHRIHSWRPDLGRN